MIELCIATIMIVGYIFVLVALFKFLNNRINK
jgi:hypothetical protein